MNKCKTIIIAIIAGFSLTACSTSTSVGPINSYEDHIRCIAIVKLISITTPDKKQQKLFGDQYEGFLKITNKKFPEKERDIDVDWAREGDRIISMGSHQLDLLAEQYAVPCNNLL